MSNINFNDWFVYDETSPSLLANKVARRGQPAGSPVVTFLQAKPGRNSYWRVSLNGKNYPVHRVVWELHNGPLRDGKLIDHINRISTDNQISNLRSATNHENLLNRVMPKADQELPQGIKGSYEARIRLDGTRYGKNSKCLETIKAWLLEMRVKLHGEFAVLDGLQPT